MTTWLEDSLVSFLLIICCSVGVEGASRADTWEIPEVYAGEVAALDSDRPAMRLAAVRSLASSRDERLSGTFEQLMCDGDPNIRAGAMYALLQMPWDRGMRVFLDLQTHERVDVRWQALRGIGYGRCRGAAQLLRTRLVDPEPRIRWIAAWALGRLGGTEDLPDLVAALQDGAPEVRVQAATALGELRLREALVALMAASGDEVASVRAAAALALGEIGDATSVATLQERTKDDDAWVRSCARMALDALMAAPSQ